jgi:hypothetical protein
MELYLLIFKYQNIDKMCKAMDCIPGLIYSGSIPRYPVGKLNLIIYRRTRNSIAWYPIIKMALHYCSRMI